MADRDVPEELAAWAAIADELDWERPWTSLYDPAGRYGSWFSGGRFNLAVNCVDRHVAARADQPAILWEGEPGDRRTLTYRQLRDEVTTLAGALRGLGVGPGDRVALHLGWLPESVVAMLACARIGAVHTVLPTPLPAEALAERLDDFRPRVLFTQDGAWRHGRILPLKAHADEALTAVGGVEHTIVVRRTGVDVAWYEGDRWLHDLVANARPGVPAQDAAPVFGEPEHPVLVSHLANHRGRPVSTLHGAATLLVSALAIHRYALAVGEVFWCAGEVSWMGAQAHGIYGPLAAGTSVVMFEGMLDVPTGRRTWEIVERYGVHTLLTTPSVIRRLRGWSGPPASEETARLRRIVTMAEPADDVLTAWLRNDVGRGRITVGDGWGQVQLSGIVSVDRPVDPRAMPSPGFAIVDERGRDVAPGERGELIMRAPWAGRPSGMEGAGAEEFTRRHWHRRGAYSTYDTARRRPDGTLEFLGRMDRLISLSGQLVSLNEVREVLLEHPFVAEAEVVERADPRLGRSLAAAVVLVAEVCPDESTARDLLEAVREILGGLSRPRTLAFVDRFGTELSTEDRRRGITLLVTGASEMPLHLTWAQIRTAATA